jgi:hypothetical protein
LAAATAGVKPRFIALPIRGPNVVPIPVLTSEMPSHAGTPAYSVSTPSKTLPSEIPDVDKIPPPGVVIVVDPFDPVEDPPRSALRSPESPDVDDVDVVGDARPCSDVVIEDSSCDSADCTPVPVGVPVACATAADWLAAPDGLVVDGGGVNAVTLEAAAEAPA